MVHYTDFIILDYAMFQFEVASTPPTCPSWLFWAILSEPL